MHATKDATERLTLRAQVAADLMTANPVSISETATFREALVLLQERGIRAAPVIDEAGHPVGVLSDTDLLIHTRHVLDQSSAGLQAESGARVENALVRDLMTPAVFSVTPDTPAERVIDEMLSLKVHRLFVIEADGILVGVISSLDVLRHLSK
jgi:CBS domain-containing protein